MISQKSVQEILDTAKIEDTIEEFVNLKRRGVNMIGLCPFHNEKTPSFTVSPAKNIYKCFGCGKGGNPVQFLMEHEAISFPEALRYLANKYGIEIEETQTSQQNIEERQEMESLYLVNQYAKEFWQDQLFNTDVGKSVGLSYFKQRGFREATIHKFGLGFSPNKKDALTLSAINKGYNIEQLRKLGLTNKFDGDFFKNRVMFTIHNLSGKVIAFGGRQLVNNKKSPKYVNSPETEVYSKSKSLYGAFFAKKAIRQKDECVIVEGYTDVISLHQSGFENVVASSGTSLTVDQIRLVKRYTPNIKLLYDGDPAGVKAALRGLDMVLAQDMNVKLVMLPEGEDPDSYLQKVGSSDFEKYLDEEAQDFILFKANLLMQDAKNDPVKKANVTQDIIRSIASIPDALKRSIYMKQCAVIMDVTESVIVETVSKEVIFLERKARSDEQKKRRIEQRRNNANVSSKPKPTTGGDPNFPSAPPPDMGEDYDGGPPPPMEDVPTKKQSPSRGAELQERDIIRLLVTGGGEIYDAEDNTTVAEYILINIEDVIDEFENKQYEKLAKLCLKELVDSNPINYKFFVNHTESWVSELAIDVSTSPFEYSHNWKDRHDITLQTQKPPELNFTEDSDNALLRFKLKKVERMISTNMKLVKQSQEAKDESQMMHYLQIAQKLNEMKKDLAKILGTVILK